MSGTSAISGGFAMAFALVAFFMSPLLGVLYNRCGRRPVILLSNIRNRLERSRYFFALLAACLLPRIVLAGEPLERLSNRTLQIELSSTASRFADSAAVRLSFSAKSLASRGMRWLPFAPPDSFDIEVKDASGTVLHPNVAPGRLPLTFGGPVSRIPILSAGARYTFVNRDSSTTFFPLSAWGYALPNGTYTLTAIFHQGSPQPISNSLTIEIGT
jgi:hypothetical protein